MAVKYVLVQKGNPAKPDESKKYYAQAKGTGEITFKKLSREIAEGSTTVSDTDILAVLSDLTKALKRHLAEGRITSFGDFGTFQLSVSSEGAKTAEKFHYSMIRGSKNNFRPSVDVKELLINLKYAKEA